jgi:diaminohydroxyphosphoribosylaminopyrimidine deaminase/5-amino-6-(5-phosphoribosylamino)uracil reductase
MRDDRHWMRRALELAARAEGETNPNPMVGCVVVKGNKVVGEGWHRRAGGPHAEVFALEQAGDRARGATLYVSLEPCCFEGRTPACAPRIVPSGVRRVVAAMRDPNPVVDGRGLAHLRRSGIETTLGVLEAEARRLNEVFAVAASQQRPFVLLKAAMTLDGRIATSAGESRWITSPSQRRAARRLRRLHDAVLVGIGTVLQDDPLLLPSPRVRRPFHRVILDSRLRLPAQSRLVRTARRAPVWVLCRRDPPARKRRLLEDAGVNVVPGRARSGWPRIDWALEALWKRGIWSVMVEGGSGILGSFLAERLFDKVVLYRAPLLLGGRGSLPAFGGPEPKGLAGAVRLERADDAPSPLDEVWYPVK